MTRRDDLYPLHRAVSDALDELNHRMHGLMSSNAYPEDFLQFLAERGYTVVPATCTETTVGLLGDLTGPQIRHRCVLGAHDGDEHRCGCGLRWAPAIHCAAATNPQADEMPPADSRHR